MSRPWERPARRIGSAAFEALASMPMSELTSLLLEVYARRARRLAARDVRRRFEQDAYVAPSSVEQLAFLRLDAHLLSQLAPRFQSVELSPLAPFGSCSVLAPVDPYSVMPTIRGQEVLADATEMLAMMAARLREERDEVHLCTTQRLVRAQRVHEKFHTQHFRILSLISAGRGDRFAVHALAEHIATQLSLLSSLPDGYHVDSLRVTLAATDSFDEIVSLLPANVVVDRDETRLAKTSYYQRYAFKVWVARDGLDLPLGDGGLTDWTAQLRADRRERFVSSAIGTEMLIKAYR
jgi:hypothetical protein